MADIKHTAPWRTFKEVGGLKEWYVKDANDKTVCTLKDEESAALIAAAPDMLEALKNAHDRGYFDPHPDDSDEEREQKRYAIETIRKATNT